MCGINGIIDYNQKYTIEKRHKAVHDMNEKIIYRGPDSEGIYDSDRVTMGMRRLSIIDLSTGEQPIYNEDKTISVVYNGEIYNYKKLRQELQDKGHIFATKTDTEVIVHAYEQYGKDAFAMLDGMFAISLFDKNCNKVFIVRDRMGEKPCYYYDSGDCVIYGSELKSLLGTGIIPKDINKEALNQYLQLTYIPAKLSIFENVYKVLPGHMLEVSLDESECHVKESCYWNLLEHFNQQSSDSYEEAQQNLYHILEKSVKDRMVTDVPLGAFLSGGIDSSIIVGLMARNSENPIETFTIGFDEKEYDERDRARLVAEFNKTNHHEYLLDYKEAFNIIDTILLKLDEPFADSSILPTYFVSHFASKNVKVVLTGDAADELFLGYSKYLIRYYADKYKKIPKWIRKCVIEPLADIMPDTTVISRKLHKVIDNSEKDMYGQREALMSMGFKSEERYQLLQPEYYHDKCLDMLEETYQKVDTEDELKKTQFLDMKYVLEGDMLAKVDRMSMLNSLETRTPMLAQELVEYAVRLSSEFKVKDKKLKRILKDSFESILPEHFTKLPKSGFSVPIDHWFRKELKEELLELFQKDRIEKQGIFQYDYVKQILEDHFSEKKNRKNEIWALYVFEKWYDNVIN